MPEVVLTVDLEKLQRLQQAWEGGLQHAAVVKLMEDLFGAEDDKLLAGVQVMRLEPCPFDRAWVSKCGKPVLDTTGYCPEHTGKECVVCGNQATHDCGDTGQFVCGANLCDECEGNGQVGVHVPKRYTLEQARMKLGLIPAES